MIILAKVDNLVFKELLLFPNIFLTFVKNVVVLASGIIIFNLLIGVLANSGMMVFNLPISMLGSSCHLFNFGSYLKGKCLFNFGIDISSLLTPRR